MYFQMAWRNIWRNPRRTAVILTAVIIGVWAMVFLGALMRGIVNGMVDNAISTLTGEIQVHQKGYRHDPVIENSITQPEPVFKALDRTLPAGAKWTQRVRLNTVAGNARHTTGVTLAGIDPEKEKDLSFMGPEAIIEGRYLQGDDKNAIVAGKALVDKFETRLGHKLVLMSQDTENEIASRAFKIVGIYRAEMEATEKQFVFVNLPAAQKMLKMDAGISEISIVLPDRETVTPVTKQLKETLPDTYEIHTWKELLRLMVINLNLYDSFMLMWYMVIFIAMGFGIVNTLLMAVFERMREFGMLKALGMKPSSIMRSVLLESFFILMAGVIAGNLLSFFSVLALSGGLDLSSLASGAEYAGMTRIIYPVLQIKDLLLANTVVLALGLLISIYPAIKAARFTAIEAMTHY